MRSILFFIAWLLVSGQCIAQNISTASSESFSKKFAVADAFTSVPFSKCHTKEALSISEKTFWCKGNTSQEEWDVYPVGQINYRDKYIAFVSIEVPFGYEELSKTEVLVVARIAKTMDDNSLNFIESIRCYKLVIPNAGGQGLTRTLESMELTGEAASPGEFGFGIGANVQGVGLFVSPFIFNADSETYRAETNRFKGSY